MACRSRDAPTQLPKPYNNQRIGTYGLAEACRFERLIEPKQLHAAAPPTARVCISHNAKSGLSEIR